jgi:midasin
MKREPLLGHILGPVQQWLETESRSLSPPEVSSPTSAVVDAVPIVTMLLRNIQVILGKCPTSPDDLSSERDKYIREDIRLITELTSLLNLKALKDLLDVTLPELAASPSNVVQSNIRRFLPFLDQYLAYAQDQLLNHSQWVQALFKLNLVLSTVMHTLAKQGFCKPPDQEVGTDSHAADAMDGVGLGEGSGQNNVSKEIEDESQVEGLKGDEDNAEDEPDRNPSDNDAIEVNDDVEGDLEDISEAEENNGSEGEDNDELDEQLGELGLSDPAALDEKLWGDQQGPKDSGDSDDKTNEDHSKQQNQSSDVVAKERRDSPAKHDSETKNTPPEKAEDVADGEMPSEIPIDEGAAEEPPSTNGGAVDEHVPDADTLELPDNMNLDFGDEMEDDPILGDEMEDEPTLGDEMEDEPALEDDAAGAEAVGLSTNAEDDVEMSQQDISNSGDEKPGSEGAPDPPEEEESRDQDQDAVMPRPDLSAGDGLGDTLGNQSSQHVEAKDAARGGGSLGNSGEEPGMKDQSEDTNGSAFVLFVSL